MSEIVINDKISITALKEYFSDDETALNIIDAQIIALDDDIAYWMNEELYEFDDNGNEIERQRFATIEQVAKEAREAEFIAGGKIE